MRRLSLLGLALLAGCYQSHSALRSDVARKAAAEAAEAAESDSTRNGLEFRITIVPGPAPAAPPRGVPVDATPLDSATVAHLLARLPVPALGDSDRMEFARRAETPPPPRAGATVLAVFPPPVSEPAPALKAPTTADTLAVLRYAPEGEVPIAASLEVTFSRPMVPVTSVAALAAADVPVRLIPQPPGQWRWVGSRTLLFEPTGRFPMATEYCVEIPAGVKSADGATLRMAVRFYFATPRMRLVDNWPEPGWGNHDLDPIIFMVFDQRIDVEALLPFITIDAGYPAAPCPFRQATAAEVEADETARMHARDAEPGRWIALRATRPLPPNATISVGVRASAPSAEGPRRTDAREGFAFRTYGPLTVTGQRCGWNESCRPHTPLFVFFSNALDAALFQGDLVHVTPEIPELKVTADGRAIKLSGITRGRTTYRVTIDSRLMDIHGQSLGQDAVRSFEVASAEPNLLAPGGDVVVLDPMASPRFSFYSINLAQLHVRGYPVTMANFDSLCTLREDWLSPAYFESSDNPPQPDVTAALTLDLAPTGAADALIESSIDLSPVLHGGLGQILLVAYADTPQPDSRHFRMARWIQSTRLGIDAIVDDDSLFIWVTDLQTGQPRGGATVFPGAEEDSALTGSDGLAVVPTEAWTGQIMSVRQGADVAFLAQNRGPCRSIDMGWWQRSRPGRMAWFVFDDRHLYRPGEELRFKGWLRTRSPGPRGDLGPAPVDVRSVDYVVFDALNRKIAAGTLTLNAPGGFDGAVDLPADMSLGSGYIALSVPGVGTGESDSRQTQHAFDVQEFRRPEYEVEVSTEPGPIFVGDSTFVSLEARYFAGGGLPDSPVLWNVHTSPAAFRPPNRDEYQFGAAQWERRNRRQRPEDESQTANDRTDSRGRSRLRINLDHLSPASPMLVTAHASVADVNRQTWADQAHLIVHPASACVGLSALRTFVRVGESLGVAAIVSDLEGRLIAGRPLHIRLVRLDWVRQGREWVEVAREPQRLDLVSKSGPLSFRFPTTQGGSYRVSAATTDARGRATLSEIDVWVAGDRMSPRTQGAADNQIVLIADRAEYRPGDVAELLVVAPFQPAEGLLMLQREGVLRREQFHMTGSSQILRIPIEEAWTPNVGVVVELRGQAPRLNTLGVADARLPLRPASARGTVELKIPPVQRRLTVEVTPREKEIEPGGSTAIDLEVRDAAGRPVSGADVVVMVVDESVLALANFRHPDPLDAFYQPRSTNLVDWHLRPSVLLARFVTPPAGGGLPGGDGGGLGLGGLPVDQYQSAILLKAGVVSVDGEVHMRGGRSGEVHTRSVASMGESLQSTGRIELGGFPPSPAYHLRRNFIPLAFFNGGTPTNAAGRATLNVTLPDNLTRYRVIAMAAAGARFFGKGESTITARLALMARPAPPRFLNFGDRFDLAVLVQNLTTKPAVVDVAVRAANARFLAGAGRRVRVPANDRVEVSFPTTTEQAGTARFQVVSVSGRATDAAEIEIPVWTPATTEAFATYGQIDDSVSVQPVAAPPDVFPQFGGLEVTTSSTALQALTDAFLYLHDYPYDCAEQRASRLLALVALRDVLGAFRAPGLPDSAALSEGVRRDIEALQQVQTGNGGFSFWARDGRDWPYLTVHVTHALVRCRAAGYVVPRDMLENALHYLRVIEGHYDPWYSLAARRSISSYALNVRAMMGDRDARKARILMSDEGIDDLSLESLGWLLPVLSGDHESRAEVATIYRRLMNRVTETAAAAHFVDGYKDGAYLTLQSERRADAVLLDALIQDRPQSDLIPKIVTGLLANRKAGRWSSTQENIFVLLALNRYFHAYEKVTPDFVARAWLGPLFAGAHAFRGRTTERHRIAIPMDAVLSGASQQDLTLAKTGPGRLYYRIGMNYAPRNLKQLPFDAGFVVARRYDALDDSTDVRRDEAGTWHIRAGARVRVSLSMVAPTRRYHVALVDPLPAGLEAISPTLPMSASEPALSSAGAMWAEHFDLTGSRSSWRTLWWYEHQNLRDERAEAFTPLLWEGAYGFSYVARATVRGRFVVPPTKAEEMYAPETFGRSGSDLVVVE